MFTIINSIINKVEITANAVPHQTIIYNKSNKNGKFRTILGAILFPYWT